LRSEEATGRCIFGALQCTFEVLPRYNGRVGASRAQTVWAGCLESTGVELGVSCASACEGEEEAEMCTSFIESLPYWADQSSECYDIAESCLDECADFASYSDWDRIQDTPAYGCWYDGQTSDCAAYVGDHEACGGDYYGNDGADWCFARCEATEGAFDEGPFDGCFDGCYDLCTEHEQICREGCEADSEDDVDIRTCTNACLVDETSAVRATLDEKAALAARLYSIARSAGLDAERLIIDPVLPNLRWPDAIAQLEATTELVRLCSSGELFGHTLRTMAGLSNLHSGLREAVELSVELEALERLEGAGLDYALLDVFEHPA